MAPTSHSGLGPLLTSPVWAQGRSLLPFPHSENVAPSRDASCCEAPQDRGKAKWCGTCLGTIRGSCLSPLFPCVIEQ